MNKNNLCRWNSFFWTVYVLVSLIYIVFGSIHLDEGAYLYASHVVYQGNIPYHDFFFLQPPLYPYIYGIIQMVFPGLLFARLTSVCFGLLTTLMLFRLTHHLSNKHGATMFLAIMTMTPFQLYFFTISRLYSLTAFFIAAGALLLFSRPSPEFKNSLLGLVALSMALGTRLTTLPIFLLACLYVILKGKSLKAKLVPPVFALTVVAAIYLPFVVMTGLSQFWFNIAGMNLSLHAHNPQANLLQKARATLQLLRFYFPVWLMLIPLVYLFVKQISFKQIKHRLTGNNEVLWILTLGMLVVHSSAKLYQVSYQTIIMPLLFCLVAANWSKIYIQSSPNNKLLYRGLLIALWLLGLTAYGRTSLSVVNGQPALMAVRQQAAFVKNHTQKGDLLFSADSPLVPAESNRNVLKGMAGSDLFSEWSTEQCRQYNVLNFDIMSDYVRNQTAAMLISGDMSFNVSLPHLGPVSESDRRDFLELIDKYYEIAGIFPNLMLPDTMTYYRIPRETSLVRPDKMLLFGIDAIGWDVLLPMIETGQLPNIQRVFENGVSANMKTLDPTVSVVLWTTMATGLLPQRHGIENWLAQSSDASGQHAITSDKRKAHAFWNLTDDKKVSIVNWWATWPVETVNGLMISNRAHFSDLAQAVHPEEAKALIANYTWKTNQELEKELTELNPLGRKIVLPDFIDQMLLRDRFYLDMAYKSLLYNDPIDILAVFVRGIDILSHEYLRDVKPDAESIPEVPQDQQGIVRSYYRYLDKWLGKYLALMGPNTGVIIVSDHGMEPVETLPPFIEGFNLDAFLTKITQLTGDLSLTNHFRDNLRYPIGLQRGISWVGDVTMTDSAVTRLANALQKVKSEAGIELFSEVSISSNPDEVIGLRLNPAIEAANVLVWNEHHIPVMSVTGMILHPRSGQHWDAPDGVFLISGPGIKASQTIYDIHISDIMPTFMAWLGLPVSRDLDGKPQIEYLSEALIDKHPVHWVDTYGSYEPQRPVSIPDSIDQELRRELESLGYIHVY